MHVNSLLYWSFPCFCLPLFTKLLIAISFEVILAWSACFSAAEMYSSFECKRLPSLSKRSTSLILQTFMSLNSEFFVQCEKMIVKPLAFDKEHLQLFFLSFVQSLLNNLAFKDFTDLMLTSKRCHLLRHLYLALLLIWACKSIVFLLHQSYLLCAIINLYINFSFYVSYLLFSCAIHITP